MKIQLGKKAGILTAEELQARIGPYPEALIDLGTGDGSYVYRFARENPSCFCIGLDPVAENLASFSAKALKKPARGGVPNALYVIASVERLPRELAGVASLITCNYPWGSLLVALTRPVPEVLGDIAALGRASARFSILLNASIYADPAYCQRQGFPLLQLEQVEAAYRDAGLAIESVERIADEPPHHTRWGSRLVRGSARETLIIEGTIVR